MFPHVEEVQDIIERFRWNNGHSGFALPPRAGQAKRHFYRLTTALRIATDSRHRPVDFTERMDPALPPLPIVLYDESDDEHNEIESNRPNLYPSKKIQDDIGIQDLAWLWTLRLSIAILMCILYWQEIDIYHIIKIKLYSGKQDPIMSYW